MPGMRAGYELLPVCRTARSFALCVCFPCVCQSLPRLLSRSRNAPPVAELLPPRGPHLPTFPFLSSFCLSAALTAASFSIFSFFVLLFFVGRILQGILFPTFSAAFDLLHFCGFVYRCAVRVALFRLSAYTVGVMKHSLVYYTNYTIFLFRAQVSGKFSSAYI